MRSGEFNNYQLITSVCYTKSTDSVAFSPDGNVITLFTSDNWVVEGVLNLLWLPPAYRATCEAVWKEEIVLGHSSGRISILGFKDKLK